MTKKISIKLTQPDRVVKSGEAIAVIIPAKEGNLTVISGRAPSMVLLSCGLVQLLDSNYIPIERYFVKGGYADVANDLCILSSELVINRSSITIDEAVKKLEELVALDSSLGENEDGEDKGIAVADEDNSQFSSNAEDIEFYQMIVNDLRAFK